MQTSYKGYPLYTFFKDAQPGDVNGHGVKDVWYAVDPEVSFLSMKNNEEVLMDKQEHEAKVKSGEWTEEEMKMMEDMEHMEASADEMKKPETTVENQGIYTAYDENLIGKTENTVIFFHATWCPSCRAADAVISKEEIPTGLTILKTDYDSNTDLRKKYGVVAQHTFVQVDANGELIKKWLGGNSVAEVVEKLK